MLLPSQTHSRKAIIDILDHEICVGLLQRVWLINQNNLIPS